MMTAPEPPLLKNHIITRCRNGRCYYDPKAKEAVVRYATMPGISLVELAHKQGISQGQLRRWVREHEQRDPVPQVAADLPSAFIPVRVAAPAEQLPSSQLSIKLPNGITVGITSTHADTLSSVLEMLCRLRCSASTSA